MPIPKVIAGVTYQVPENNEDGWGEELSKIVIALIDSGLERGSGSFPLTTPLDFGSSHGLTVLSLTSKSSTPAVAGFLRLSNTDVINWRNAANNGDLSLSVSAGKIRFDGIDLVDLSSSQTLTNKTYTGIASSLVIDADTNSISNLGVGNLAIGVLDTDLAMVAGTDTTLPSAKAVKTYADGLKDATETLTNKTMTSPTINGGTINDATLGGTTTIVNSTELQVTDPHIEVNKGGTDPTSEGAGIIVDRAGTNGAIEYKATSGSKFACGAVGSIKDIVDVSSTQTLTNKTLTSPTLNDVTINLNNMTLVDGVFTNGNISNHLRVTSVSSDPTTPVITNEILVFNKLGKLYKIGTDGVVVEIGSKDIEIFNFPVSGDFTALTIGTDLFQLAMYKADKAYEITEFSIIVTNESDTTQSGDNLDLRLEKKDTGIGNTGWTEIAQIDSDATGTITATLPTDGTEDITLGDYIRIRPVTFRTDQSSFYLIVKGNLK